MALTKPSVDAGTWANGATTSPDMVIPSAGLVNTGFLAPPTLPKRGHTNWILNKLHQGLRYYLAQGVPAWDASETNYAVGSMVTFSGLCYILNVATPAGTNPATDTAHWGLLVPVQTGTLLRRSILASGTSLAKYSADVRRARMKILAGGGPGGVVSNSGSVTTGTGGGAAGGYAEWETTTIPATWGYAIGAGGVSGNASGGPTTITDGVTTVTANGGPSGSASFGGAAPAISTNGTLNASGQPGSHPVNTAAGAIISGAGGSSVLGGAGGPSSLSTINGLPGIGPGAGGGGGVAVPSTTVVGGSGTAGIIILEEYA